MAALTANRDTLRKDPTSQAYGVAAAVIIFAGAAVCTNAAGNAVNASDTTGLITAGVAKDRVDNSAGSAGALDVVVLRTGVYKFAVSGTAPTVGAAVYWVDNQTVGVAATTTNDIKAGIVTAVETGYAWVDISKAI